MSTPSSKSKSTRASSQAAETSSSAPASRSGNTVQVRKDAKAAAETPAAAASRSPGSSSTHFTKVYDHETGVWLSVKSVRAAAQGASGPGGSGKSAPGTEAILLSPDTGVIEIDQDKTITYASELCAEMFGWEHLVGQEVGILLKGGLQNEFGHALHQSQAPGQESQRYSFLLRALKRDGTEFPVAIILTRMSSPSKTGWMVVFRIPVSNEEAAEQLRAGAQGTTEEVAKVQAADSQTQTRRKPRGKGSKEQEPPTFPESIELPDTPGSGTQLLDQLQSNNEELRRSFNSLREQLEVAKATAVAREDACTKESARAKSLEDSFERLRQIEQEMAGKLQTQQNEGAQLRSRLEELEKRVREESEALNKTRNERQQLAEEHDREKSTWQQQLSQVKATAAEAEKAWMEEGERSKRFEAELTEVRRISGELEGKLKESAGELARIQGDLNQQIAERERAQTELSRQLELAKSTGSDAERARTEEVERRTRVESELSEARRAREEFQAKLTSEQQGVADSKRRIEELEAAARETTAELERVKGEVQRTAAERQQAETDWARQFTEAKAATAQATEAAEQAKAELQRQVAERQQAEADWARQLTEAKATSEKSESGRHEEGQKFAQVQTELAETRQAREQLQAKLATQGLATDAARRKVKDLEQRLRQSSQEVTRLKGELLSRPGTADPAVADLANQWTAAKAAAEKAEAARAEESEKAKRLESELAELRQTGEELNGRLTTERQAAAEARQRIEQLEQQVREARSQADRAKAEMEKQTHAELDYKNLSEDATQTLADICRLRQNEAAYKAQLRELEGRLRDGIASLARMTADYEKERGERKRSEHRSASMATQLQELHEELKQHLESEKVGQSRISDLEQNIRERDELISRMQLDMHKETADRQLAEEQLQAAGDMSAQLRKYLALFEESKKVFRKAQEQLESRLEASQSALHQYEGRLQKEAQDRQRAEEALQTAQRQLNEATERNTLELAKLESELQVEQFERKRIEGSAVQSRFASLDSARVGRALVNNLQRQVLQPVDKLLKSTRSLLESDLQEESKKLVETMLENVLLVQTTLQQSGSLGVAAALAGESDGSESKGKDDDSAAPLDKAA